MHRSVLVITHIHMFVSTMYPPPFLPLADDVQTNQAMPFDIPTRPTRWCARTMSHIYSRLHRYIGWYLEAKKEKKRTAMYRCLFPLPTEAQPQ